VIIPTSTASFPAGVCPLTAGGGFPVAAAFSFRFECSACQQGELSFHGQLKRLTDENNWRSFLKSLYSSKWVVYAKPPFGGAKQVLKYLARYTHRVAISNQRLVSIENGKVCFQWKDYANGNQQRTMTLDGVEFLRRFLLHVLPKGFMRIRYYGFLANRHRKEKLALCRKLLGLPEKTTLSVPETPEQVIDDSVETGRCALCPVCKKGRMLEIETIRPDPTGALTLAYSLVHDTS
jgi:hypothetical protein